MKNVCWALIGLAALAFIVGSFLTLIDKELVLAPVGYWRGAIGFLAFAVALRVMDMKS